MGDSKCRPFTNNMKKLIVTIIFLIFLTVAGVSHAHFRGVPIIKINDKFTNIYTQNEFATIGDSTVPTDIAAEQYIKGKEVTFEIEPQLLPYPEEVVAQAKFAWNFGDGQKASGKKVVHTYQKAGTYVLTLNIDYGDISQFGYMGADASTLVQQQSVVVHIIPTPGYKIPTPVIRINGKEYTDKTKDQFDLKFDYKLLGLIKLPASINFDASESKGSKSIKKVEWDFGDGKLISGEKVNHSFTQDYYLYDIGLRITDENGFYTDTFISIANKYKETEENQKNSILPIIIAGNVVLAIVIVITFIVVTKLRKKKEKE